MKKIFIILLCLGALVVVFYAFNSYLYVKKQGTSPDTEPYRAALSGEVACLPKKAGAPQTEECASGFRTATGEYFAIDFSLMAQTPPSIETGDHFTASGLVTPIERLSADQWRTYDIAGIFSVTDSMIVKEKDPPQTPGPVAPKKCYIGGCSAQLCTDTPNMASTCEYNEIYACYQGATCEQQPSGACGWTPTPTLTACLER